MDSGAYAFLVLTLCLGLIGIGIISIIITVLIFRASNGIKSVMDLTKR